MKELLLIATIAGERLALSAAEVESVVEIEAVKPVPRAAPHVAGLTALRSRVLTVIDSVAALGEPCVHKAAAQEAVVVEVDGHHYALLVDSVEDVVEHEGEMRPVRTPIAPGWRRVARGTVEVGGDLLLLVDTRALLAGPAAAAA